MMAKEEKKALVPKLRFPDFRDAKSWVRKPLGELFEITSCRRVHQSEWTDNGVPFYRARDLVALHDGEPIRPLYISEELYERNAAQSGEICEGHLLVTGVGSIGVPYLVKKEDRFYFKDGNIIWLKNPGDVLTGRFLHLLYCSDVIQKQITTLSGVGTVGTYTIDNAKRTVAAFPLDKQEQQEIANCLSSLDELIAAQGRKVEALKTYKRGLMQQLFPREGETRPRLRFPEFRDAPEWKEVNAGTLFANRTERGDDSLPIYSVTMTDGLVKRASLDRRIDDLAESTGNKKAHRYDIAYNMMRMWQGACGIASEECMVSPAYVVLSPQSDVHAPFYGYLFKLPHMLQVFTAHSRGLTEDRLRLYYQDFSSIPLPQPDMREQVRIADGLMALDARIFDESEKLDDLKTHKSGLLQQLFPSLEET